jgi:4-amino-4-deoxy-L-arabinose transferase-like glycosyltransferase
MKTQIALTTRLFAGYRERLLPLLAQREKVVLALIFCLALLVRVLWVALLVGFDAPPTYDGIGYDQLAINLLEGRGFRYTWPDTPATASRVPGYPLFLAGIYFLGGHRFWLVRFVQAVIGAVTCLVIYQLGKKVANRRVGLLAAFAASFYPLFLYIGGLLYSETLALFLLTVALLLGIDLFGDSRSRIRALSIGLLLAIAALVHPLVALVMPLLILGLVVLRWPVGIGLATALLVGLVVVFAPWAIRNYAVFQTFIPLSTMGGAGFWSGNNLLADGGLVDPGEQTWTEGVAPDLGHLGWSELGEPASSNRFMRTGLEWIKNHPTGFVALTPKKLARLWSPTAYGRQFSRYSSNVEVLVLTPPYLLFMALAFYGTVISRSKWRPLIPLYIAIVICNVNAVLFFGATRYSFVMAPSLIILAGWGADALAIRLGSPGIPSLGGTPSEESRMHGT